MNLSRFLTLTLLPTLRHRLAIAAVAALSVSFAFSSFAFPSLACAADVLNFDTSAPSAATKKALNEARLDFDAVVQGKLPRYAKPGTTGDSSSTLYKGHGYSLTIVKQLSRLGEVDGYLYGPVLTFEPILISGNGDTLSDVRFYSSSAMQKLMKQKRTG